MKRDIANLKAAMKESEVEEAFMPSISPSNVEEWQRNAYYSKHEDYIVAIAEASTFNISLAGMVTVRNA